MDMDVDWCLTCQKHIEGSSPYCSQDCEFLATPPRCSPQLSCHPEDDDEYDSSPYAVEDDTLETGSGRWLGNDDAGIAAWAAEIPPGAPAGDVLPVCEPTTFKRPILSTTYRPPPNLVKSSRRVIPPSLCMTSSLPRTSSPIVTPPRQPSIELLGHASNKPSFSKTSSKSAKSESPVSTPASSHGSHLAPIFCPSRKSSIFGEMYIHVRSWVSPSPVVVLAEPTHRRQPPPVNWVDPSKLQKTLTYHHPRPSTTKSPICETYGRSRFPPELACHDEIPSFRARGRKASRAAA